MNYSNRSGKCLARDEHLSLPGALFLYLAIRNLLGFGALTFRSEPSNEIELLALRHEVPVLLRQIGRPVYQPAYRALLAALSRLLSRTRWGGFGVTAYHLVELAPPAHGETLDVSPPLIRSSGAPAARWVRTNGVDVGGGCYSSPHGEIGGGRTSHRRRARAQWIGEPP